MSVIGGADGPTAIFVASSINWLLIIGAVIVIAGVIIAISVIRRKKKK